MLFTMLETCENQRKQRDNLAFVVESIIWILEEADRIAVSDLTPANRSANTVLALIEGLDRIAGKHLSSWEERRKVLRSLLLENTTE